MEDWKFVEKDPSEALAKLHFFSIKKKHASGEVEARITVKEFASAKTTDMKFFAVADLELNQKTMKFQPCGWAETLMGALTECLRNLRKFEYESPESAPSTFRRWSGALTSPRLPPFHWFICIQLVPPGRNAQPIYSGRSIE